ncbi:MAG: DedA family protein [Bacteroidales bacterium]
MLFSVGVLAAGGGLSLLYAVPALVLGGIAGTRVAYFLGVKTGNLLFMKRPERRQNQLRQAQEFYRKHGNKTFVLSRFLPVIRAIVPLVAGIAKMDKGRFWKYTVLSVSLWVVLITLVGFQLGQLPVVKRYFGVVILLVSAFSLTSVGILAIRQKMRAGNPSENTSKS